MSLAFVVPALYKIPKTLLSWATNPPQIPLLHVTTYNVHRCRNRKWYRIRWTDWLWSARTNYELLCSWTVFFVNKQGKRNDLETKKMKEFRICWL